MIIPDERSAGPSDAGRPRRLEWAQLLKRVFAIDVLTCQRCGGPMRLISIVAEPTASEILARFGLPSRAPPRGLSRPPPDQADLIDVAPDYDTAPGPVIE